MKDEPKLKPCPFCDGTHIDYKNPYGKVFFVCCYGCGCMSGYEFNLRKAVKKWNTRKDTTNAKAE